MALGVWSAADFLYYRWRIFYLTRGTRRQELAAIKHRFCFIFHVTASMSMEQRRNDVSLTHLERQASLKHLTHKVIQWNNHRHILLLIGIQRGLASNRSSNGLLMQLDGHLIGCLHSPLIW
jgi:hypothetical protein